MALLTGNARVAPREGRSARARHLEQRPALRRSPTCTVPQARQRNRGDARTSTVLLAVTPDLGRSRQLRADLQRRFGADYRVITANSPRLATEMLERFRAERIDVAMVLADFHLPKINGIEFLARTRATHPSTKRALLSTFNDHAAAAPIHRAMALGQVDFTVYWPWMAPEEALYPHLSEALASWWRSHRPRFERVQIVGEQWEARSHELRDLGTRNGVPYGFYPADSPAGLALLREHGLDGSSLPVVIVDGQPLVDPSIIDIANTLGATTRAPSDICDVAIIGAGPAGLAAAVYAASEGLRTVVIEPVALGGQAGTSSMIRNYLGFPRGISGEEITSRAHEQALHFGAEVVHTHAAVGLRAEGPFRIVTLSDGSELRARTVVLATGVSYRRLDVSSLERLIGAGVYYGAATTEARALAGENVYVVGAGNSAGQAALHLAAHARQVTMVVRGETLTRTMSTYLIRQIEEAPNIDVRLEARVVDGIGDYRLEGLVLEDARGKRSEVDARALFVLIGARPRTDWLDGTLHRDASGYILTCRDLAQAYEPMAAEWPLLRSPFALETSMPGVFGVGDVRHRSVKRVASAAGEGAISIFSIHEYLAGEPAVL